MATHRLKLLHRILSTGLLDCYRSIAATCTRLECWFECSLCWPVKMKYYLTGFLGNFVHLTGGNFESSNGEFPVQGLGDDWLCACKNVNSVQLQ